MKKKNKMFSVLAAGALLLQALTFNVAAADTPVAPPVAWGPVPSQSQLDYHEEELAAFIHFGVNTFTNSEWGNGSEDPNVFNPTELDTDQWVKTLKDAGFKRVIMIGRHHDGFCLWKSEHTEHDVENSRDFQAKGGDGDVLLSVSKSCTKYDMDMGLYLSPWDANNPSYGYGSGTNEATDSNGDYNEYYMNQLTEVLGNPKYGNNGKFVEVWMDGAKGTGAAKQQYKLLEWFDLIEDLEPGALVFSTYGTGIRWVGNESGIAGDPCWSKILQSRMREAYDNGFEEAGYLNSGDPNGDIWSIGEADVSIENGGWFWHPGNTTKDMAKLTDIYFKSVGRGQPLLLNIPPDKRGKFSDNDVTRIGEFGDAIKTTFRNDLTSGEGVSVTASSTRGNSNTYSAHNVVDADEDTYWTMDDGQKTGSLTIDLGGFQYFDVVSIEEYIKLGQRISDFNVEVHTAGGWQPFDEGHTIGAKRLSRNSPVTADQVRINITGSQAVPVIKKVGVFKGAKVFEMPKLMPDGVQTIDNPNFAMTGVWNQEQIGNNNTSMYSVATGATASATFTGTKAWVYGTTDVGHGIMEVWIDDQKVADVDTYRSSRKLPSLLYTTDDLSNGSHTIKIVVKGQKNSASTGNAIGLDFLAYLNNNGAGMFEIENESYTVNEGENQNITINRVGGSTGAATVHFLTLPDSAVHGRHYKELSTNVEFADGQESAVVTVETIDNTEVADNLSFLTQIEQPTNGAVLGFQTLSSVTIRDNDYNGSLDDKLNEAKTKNEGLFTGASWALFEPAYAYAQAVKNNPDATAEEISKATNDLAKALKGLQARTSYSSEDPFTLPNGLGKNKLAEAEFFKLVPTTPVNAHVRVEDVANASNGKMVTWFENGDAIKLPYTTKDTGTFTVTATYRSGRASASPNKINWSGENIKSGSVSVYGPNSSESKTVSFDVEISKAGAGELIFSADSSSSPNIDKFEISAKALDKQALIDYVEECKDLVASDYTKESFDAFTVQLEKAKAMIEAIVTKAEISEMLTALTDARTALVEAGQEDTTFMKSILKSAIDKAVTAEASAEFNTLAPSVRALITRMRTEAQAVYANAAASNTQCMDAWLNLANALQFLDFQADKAALFSVIEGCSNINPDDYTIGVEEYKAALADAQAVYNNPNVLQATIDAARDRLIAAKEGLKKENVNKTLLEILILGVEGNVNTGDKYNKESGTWDIYVQALANAKAILANAAATQEEVDLAISALSDAYQNIRLLPSEDQLAELNTFLNKVKGINRSNFTSAQLAVIDKTAAQVQSMINDFDDKAFAATKTAMNKALDMINDVSAQAPSKPGTPGTSGNANAAQPNTGDTTNAAVIMFALIISGCGLAMILRKRNRKA